jgi:hypothetical protein
MYLLNRFIVLIGYISCVWNTHSILETLQNQISVETEQIPLQLTLKFNLNEPNPVITELRTQFEVL